MYNNNNIILSPKTSFAIDVIMQLATVGIPPAVLLYCYTVSFAYLYPQCCLLAPPWTRTTAPGPSGRPRCPGRTPPGPSSWRSSASACRSTPRRGTTPAGRCRPSVTSSGCPVPSSKRGRQRCRAGAYSTARETHRSCVAGSLLHTLVSFVLTPSHA